MRMRQAFRPSVHSQNEVAGTRQGHSATSNDIVRPIHAKAMSVILTKPEEFDVWLDGSVNDAITLQRPLPNQLLGIIATGKKSDYARVEE